MKNKELIKEEKPTTARYQRDSLIKKMFKEHQELHFKYFLDICGVGGMLVFLDNLKMYGEGIDLSNESIEIAKSRVSKNIKVYQKDFMEIEKEFELIIMLDVLEHIQDDNSFVRKANQLLEEDGYFLINVPAKMNLYSNADAFYGHYRRYERTEIENLLWRNGFKIEEFWSYGFSFLNKVFAKMMPKNKENLKENTKKSGTQTPNFMKYIYPMICWFYFLLKIQHLFKKKDIGTQYLILAKKEGNIL